MKKLALIIAATLTLTACATGQEAYYAAIAEREKRQAEMEMRADTAIAQMAATGDAQAKGMAIMYFANRAGAARANGGQGIAPPRSTAEQLLPWASLFVPTLTQVYGIQKQTEVQINSSNNSLAAQQSNNSLIRDIVVTPIIGTEDDVLLFPSQ